VSTNANIFAPSNEVDVTRTIVGEFAEQFQDYISSDAIIVGAGPAGLMCGMRLAADGHKVMIIERNNYLGGGFWLGGYFMNKLTVREPANRVFDEIGVPYKQAKPGLHVTDGPHACSRLIAAACDAGVKFANLTMVDDVVIREGNRVSGVVINWSPVKGLPRQITCVDPVAIESKVVIDATGHDAVVAKILADHGMMEIGHTGPMWVERSEDVIVERTAEVHPGLVVIGMAVSTVYNLPRMGPTFGAMLLSGERGAELAAERINTMRTTEVGEPAMV
jgi:thiazole biosynthesis enzyme